MQDLLTLPSSIERFHTHTHRPQTQREPHMIHKVKDTKETSMVPIRPRPPGGSNPATPTSWEVPKAIGRVPRH